MKELLSIGELSKLQNISKQTLIFYDKLGLFCPVYKDEVTGYRYYSMNQIDYLDTILIMKKMGLSLNEIKQFMKVYNIDESIDLLNKQIPILDEQIYQLKMIKSRIEHKKDDLEKIRKIRSIGSEVMIEDFEKKSLFIKKVKSPFTLEQVSIATKRCYVDAYQNQLPIYLQSGAIIPLSNVFNKKYTYASHVFLTCEDVVDREDVVVLEGGKVVSMYHVGDYRSIGRTYEKILDFCEKMKLEIVSDSYEFAVHDYLSTKDESEYITKVLFFIK